MPSRGSYRDPSPMSQPLRLRRHTDGCVGISLIDDMWIVVRTDDGWYLSATVDETEVTGPGWSELLVTELPEPAPVFVKLIDAISPLIGAIALRFQAAETDGFCDNIYDHPGADPQRVAGLREAAAAMRQLADSMDPPGSSRLDDENERLQSAISSAGLFVAELPEQYRAQREKQT